MNQVGNVFQYPYDNSTQYMFVRDSYFANTLWRTSNIADPTAWRGWDGSGYTVRSVDPYHNNMAGFKGFASIPGIPHSFSWNFVCDCWLGISDGVMYSTSNDLIHWSEQIQVLSNTPTINLFGPTDPNVIIAQHLEYPSFYDFDFPRSGTDDMNLNWSGNSGHLYFRYTAPNGSFAGIRIPVSISLRTGSEAWNA